MELTVKLLGLVYEDLQQSCRIWVAATRYRFAAARPSGLNVITSQNAQMPLQYRLEGQSVTACN